MNNITVVEMKTYLEDFKKLSIDEQRKKAKKSLMNMGYIDSELNILPPYNRNINEGDFTQGPGEIQYVKKRMM